MRKDMFSNDLKRKSGMVRVLGGFSEQNGLLKHNAILQIDEFEDNSRMQISNELYRMLDIVFREENDCWKPSFRNNVIDNFCNSLLNDVFCERSYLYSGYHSDWKLLFEKIHDVIMLATYNEVLDIIQYIYAWIEYRIIDNQGVLVLCMNKVFEKENIGYRFIGNQITPITDEQELSAIEEACKSPIDGCRKQIQKAVAFLSDREHPDYKNCIKESISAVESICQVIVGDNKATLGDALKKLEDKGVQIHPALKQGFLKLYGYSSDQGGIRHAEGMFESNVTFEEAKFMLVSCSAFINYLIAEFGKRGN